MSTISVGNITMGGTGKTPFTVFMAEHYLAQSRRVAILSRGYKGGLGTDNHVISDGKDIFYAPPQAADEPYMMARALPKAVVITGKDRNRSQQIAKEIYSCDLFLLDDGFQHKVHRDLDILLLDYHNPISTGFIFPFGMLREMPKAIKRADIIVFTRANKAEMNPKVATYCEGKPVFYCNHTYACLCAMGKQLPLNAIAGRKSWLLSGIASPAQFEEQVRGLGCEVLGHSRFRDHYAYTPKDIRQVLKDAGRAGADILLTTEKDYVRIPARMNEAFIYPVVKINMLSKGFFEAVKAKILTLQ